MAGWGRPLAPFSPLSGAPALTQHPARRADAPSRSMLFECEPLTYLGHYGSSQTVFVPLCHASESDASCRAIDARHRSSSAYGSPDASAMFAPKRSSRRDGYIKFRNSELYGRVEFAACLHRLNSCQAVRWPEAPFLSAALLESLGYPPYGRGERCAV